MSRPRDAIGMVYRACDTILIKSQIFVHTKTEYVHHKSDNVGIVDAAVESIQGIGTLVEHMIDKHLKTCQEFAIVNGRFKQVA